MKKTDNKKVAARRAKKNMARKDAHKKRVSKMNHMMRQAQSYQTMSQLNQLYLQAKAEREEKEAQGHVFEDTLEEAIFKKIQENIKAVKEKMTAK